MIYLALVILNLALLVYLFLMMIKKINEIEERAINRHAKLSDWLFQSLYSLDNKVLLPTEADKPLDTKPAKVYNPALDPMSEFNGMRDDL